MISKKRRHKGLLKSAPPTTGRAAFRGILHPLILGGQNIAPSSTATTANFDPYSQATVTVPSTDDGPPQKLKDPCELSATEKAWCDINPLFSWCDKVGLTSNDPKCVPNNIKCPPSQKWLDTAYSTDKSVQIGPLRDFLSEDGIMNGVNGMCIDAAIAKDKEAEANKSLCLMITPPNGVVQRYCPMSETMKSLYVKTNTYGKDKVLSDGTVLNWYAQ